MVAQLQTTNLYIPQPSSIQLQINQLIIIFAQAAVHGGEDAAGSDNVLSNKG
jgi:hypothetical protein